MSDWITALYRSGEYACTAYVTFKDAYALETAVLLSVSFYIHPASRGSIVLFGIWIVVMYRKFTE